MNRLIWKELNDQRYVPIAYAGLLAMGMLVWFVMGSYVAAHGGSPTDRMTAAGASGLLWIGISWSGLLAGSSTISAEVGSGTLSFLSAMPVSRARIWCLKIIAALGISIVSSVAMIAVYAIGLLCLFGHNGSSEVRSFLTFQGLFASSDWIFVGFTFVMVFAIAILTSTVTDRPLAAVGATVFVSAIVTLTMMNFFNESVASIGRGSNYFDFFGDPGTYGWTHGWTQVSFETPNFQETTISENVVRGWTLFATVYAMIAVLISSLLTFKIGTTLRSWRRFILALAPVAIAGCLAGLPLVGYLYVEHLALMEHPRQITWSEVLTVPNASRSKIKSVATVIEYGRVKAGTIYAERQLVEESRRMANVPVLAKAYSSDITASLAESTYESYDGMMVTRYFVTYVYRPQLPYGDETRRIDLISASGNVVGTVDIKAHKTPGFFPSQRWFGFPNRGIVNVY